MLSEAGGLQSRTGGLSVSLSGSEGQVLGGAVAGLLMAASSVQVLNFCAFSMDDPMSPSLWELRDHPKDAFGTWGYWMADRL